MISKEASSTSWMDSLGMLISPSFFMRRLGIELVVLRFDSAFDLLAFWFPQVIDPGRTVFR
jgi:hypothetical protein